MNMDSVHYPEDCVVMKEPLTQKAGLAGIGPAQTMLKTRYTGGCSPMKKQRLQDLHPIQKRAIAFDV